MRIIPLTLSTAQITGIVRTMRKLGDGKTVRIFTPVPVELRDQFKAACNGDDMSGVMRELITSFIAEKAKPARKRERETA